MSQKPWHLNRRTFLHGTGVALALPMLECMAKPAGTRPKSTPPRLCCVFFANGVSLPPVDHADHKKWNWFPLGEGANYRLTQTLKPLEPFRQDMTILGGLSHPLGRLLVGHATADIWLTGGDVRGSEYRNSISFDQRVAREQGKHTRFPSLVLSSNGGVGYKTRTTTVSFNRSGEAIPAESNPRQIFERLFSGGGTASLRARKRQLQQDRRIVDLVLEDSRNLKRRLGHHDQQKLEEYLEAVHEIERRLERTEAWLAAPRPTVDPGQLNLTVSQNSPRDYIRTMYDLMLLAFQTDTTRVATYQISQEDGKGVSDRFPTIALKLKGHHGLSHDHENNPGAFERWAQYDRFLAEQHAYFLRRLQSVREAEGSMLDNTMVLFGSATSTTHDARNYPLVLAGGRALGLKHGKYLKYTEQIPLANMYVSMLQKLGVETERFADSTGTLNGLT